ncbi:hypothetical protein QUB52_28510 [Microcoleus sp. A6-C6]|uniref:hypothetical protein n=1 Tax=unclassified Microcoleus TaxID=2642155 RepID=UPI002FD4181A
MKVSFARSGDSILFQLSSALAHSTASLALRLESTAAAHFLNEWESSINAT